MGTSSPSSLPDESSSLPPPACPCPACPCGPCPCDGPGAPAMSRSVPKRRAPPLPPPPLHTPSQLQSSQRQKETHPAAAVQSPMRPTRGCVAGRTHARGSASAGAPLSVCPTGAVSSASLFMFVSAIDGGESLKEIPERDVTRRSHARQWGCAGQSESYKAPLATFGCGAPLPESSPSRKSETR
jgi:hypothetical protein